MTIVYAVTYFDTYEYNPTSQVDYLFATKAGAEAYLAPKLKLQARFAELQDLPTLTEAEEAELDSMNDDVRYWEYSIDEMLLNP